MELFNPALEENITFVRPAYFIITGFIGIPNVNFYFVFLLFVYVLSVVGNGTVLTLIIVDHTLRGPKYVAVFSLALTDILSSTAFLPKIIDIFLFNHRYISYNECLTFMFFGFTLPAMQSFNLVALSYDRLMAIMYPLHYQVKVTQRFMINLIAFLWIFSITLILILVTHKIMFFLIASFWFFAIIAVLTAVGLLSRLSFCRSVVINSYFCDHGLMFELACNDNFPSIIISFILPVFILWLPMIFILSSYICIAIALFRVAVVKERVKALKTCTGHLSLVAIYFIPILITFTIGAEIHPNARIINLSLTSVFPPMLNPIVYVLHTQEIRLSIKRILKFTQRDKVMAK
ncbi:olfactory receptor 2AT4-like [Poecilia formosa]|uniref:olfactory receptor 2AT4-like n=1 Tax=Poecilia formosa TaxID=48698 RepID=UPI0007B8F0AE|nr:PREDICTED: olfactory receptor 2AT4-like [Poecilia formosa]